MTDAFFVLFGDVLKIFVFLGENSVFWMPVVLGIVLWKIWRAYLLRRYLSQIEWVLLEIKLPKEIKKTPLAMEIVLAGLYQSSTGEWYEQLTQGRVMIWFSLELVSIEGAIHFFIRTPKIFQTIVETHIYSQYPGVEIYEVPDYAKYVNYQKENTEWEMWGQEYKLNKEDAYPIKTYIDFNIDKEGVKDEEKVDPMTPTLEWFGSLGKDEQLWLQILIQPAKSRANTPGKWFKKRDWCDEGKSLINKIIEKSKLSTPEDFKLTPSDEELVKALQRNISKLGFDCGIRTIYWVKTTRKFDGARVKGLLKLFNQYRSPILNSFAPAFTIGFDFPWQDFRGIRAKRGKSRLFNAYKYRSYFYPPRECKPFVLSMEELATIYHFPGQVAEIPTFGRIESRKGEPPSNLPI